MTSESKADQIVYTRIRRYDIQPQIFPHLFRTGANLVVDVGIPDNATFRGFAHNIANNTIAIFMEHPSFDAVHESEQFPVAPPLVVREIREG